MNEITMTELHDLLQENLKALWASPAWLDDAPHQIPPVMIWGAPGVGKSTVIRELAAELGVGFIDVRLAQRDPVDMRGLPVPENDRVKWLVSSEWPRDPDSRGIILFDELTAADKTLQVASYEFILDRRLGDLYQVPRNWYIVAAGNRVEDKAVACAMSSALANRFLHVEVRADAKSFVQWATARNVHPAVINFIRYHPNLLFADERMDRQRGWPSPRSWERVSTMLKIAEKSPTDNLLNFAVAGLIGDGAATEFLAFYKNVFTFQNQFDLRSQLLNGDVIEIPGRADLVYACCSAIKYNLEKENNERDLRKMIDTFLEFSLRLSGDYAMMAMNDVMSCLQKKNQHTLLLTNPRYRQWLEKYGAKRR